MCRVGGGGKRCEGWGGRGGRGSGLRKSGCGGESKREGNPILECRTSRGKRPRGRAGGGGVAGACRDGVGG